MKKKVITLEELENSVLLSEFNNKTEIKEKKHHIIDEYFNISIFKKPVE